MAILERKVKIEWKLNPSYFSSINSKHISVNVQRIGSTRTAVNRMLINDEMMRTLMPPILGIDPRSAVNNWSKDLADYWHALSVEVPENGLVFDASLNFDISDGHSIRKPYIQKFLSDNKDIKTSEQMRDALTDISSKHYVKEEELYRYAEPINTYDYLVWYYCKGYRDVANDLSSVNKSNNIRFYMVDEAKQKAARKVKSLSMIDATNKYVELSKDSASLKAIYSVIKPMEAKKIYSMADEELIIEVHGLLMSSPHKFLELANDKNLKVKGEIEQMVASGVIKRIPETSTIVDSIDQTKVMGNTIEEMIVYMNSDKEDVKKHVNELRIRLKNTVK